MMKRKLKNALKDKRGLTTIEILSWIAIFSIIVVSVATALKPDIVGNDSILTNSSSRIKGLEDVMKP